MPLTGFTIIDSHREGARQIGDRHHLALTYTTLSTNPESKAFNAAYQAKFNAAPDLFADYGYVAAKALRRGVEDDQTATPQQGQLARR